MAFKTAKQYNEEKFGSLFLLRNDNDYADVIFLYRDIDDVLIADVHYIKSADYSGYVHCCGAGCPACAKGIRVQTKLFIPMYNLTTNQIEFWDRSVRFENQLNADVFEKFPNPSEFVFRIQRHGVAGDVNTTYQITPVGKNTQESYAEILSKFNIKMPDHYEAVCRDISAPSLQQMLNTSDSNSSVESLPSYQVTPRTSTLPESTGTEIPVTSQTLSVDAIPDVDTGLTQDNILDVPELDDDVVF